MDILVGESAYRLQAVSEFGQELCKVINKAIQALNVFHIGGLLAFPRLLWLSVDRL